MVATTKQTSKVLKRAGLNPGRGPEGPEPTVELRDLVAPLDARRGVKAHASDWLSRLERRAAYLPL